MTRLEQALDGSMGIRTWWQTKDRIMQIRGVSRLSGE